MAGPISVSAIADQIMYAYGRRRIFILGNVITAAFTALLGAATLMPDGAPFAAFCLVSQIGQGFGSALAEASSFALIAELFPRRVTFYFGLNETFTGLGVAIGPPIGGLLFAIGGWSYVIWGIFVRLVVVFHATWFVNSATHKFGYKSYESNDNSRNCWWVALLTFGEGWHNNHHAYQYSARHGLRWWEIDATWLLIRTLKFLGLATDVKLAPTKN
jgi:MFS family permease